MKIVSFLPSATEVLFQLGLGPSLAARSHECNCPPEALATEPIYRIFAESRDRKKAEALADSMAKSVDDLVHSLSAYA